MAVPLKPEIRPREAPLQQTKTTFPSELVISRWGCLMGRRGNVWEPTAGRVLVGLYLKAILALHNVWTLS